MGFSLDCLQGEALPQSKLTSDDVLEIRERHESGESIYSMYRDYGLSYGAIWKAANYETWRHV